MTLLQNSPPSTSEGHQEGPAKDVSRRWASHAAKLSGARKFSRPRTHKELIDAYFAGTTSRIKASDSVFSPPEAQLKHEYPSPAHRFETELAVGGS